MKLQRLSRDYKCLLQIYSKLLSIDIPPFFLSSKQALKKSSCEINIVGQT
jgi:hypothetical protein